MPSIPDACGANALEVGFFVPARLLPQLTGATLPGMLWRAGFPKNAAPAALLAA